MEAEEMRVLKKLGHLLARTTHKYLINMVKRRKLQWTNHISRLDGRFLGPQAQA